MATNVIVISGRLTADPELKKVGEYDLLTFSIAFDVGWGDKKHAVFVPCKLWGKRGPAILQYMHKGKSVVVTGSWDCEKWKDKDGVEHRKDIINCSDVELGADPKGGYGASEQPMQPKEEETLF